MTAVVGKADINYWASIFDQLMSAIEGKGAVVMDMQFRLLLTQTVSERFRFRQISGPVCFIDFTAWIFQLFEFRRSLRRYWPNFAILGGG